MTRPDADQGAPTPEDSTLTAPSQDGKPEDVPEPERRRSVDMFRDLAEEMGIEFVEEEPEPGSGMMITPAPSETEDRIPNV